MHFPYAETRALETLAKVRAILPHEIARGSDEADVSAGAQRFADGDAQHHFGFAGARRRLEQKLEIARGEACADRCDRVLLIVGERELLAWLDEFVGERNGLRILLDLVPNGARRAG